VKRSDVPSCADRVLYVVDPERVWDICVVIVGIVQRNSQVAAGRRKHAPQDGDGDTTAGWRTRGENRTNNSPCDLHPANPAKYTFIVSWPAKRAHPTWQRPSYPTNLHTEVIQHAWTLMRISLPIQLPLSGDISPSATVDHRHQSTTNSRIGKQDRWPISYASTRRCRRRYQLFFCCGK